MPNPELQQALTGADNTLRVGFMALDAARLIPEGSASERLIKYLRAAEGITGIRKALENTAQRNMTPGQWDKTLQDPNTKASFMQSWAANYAGIVIRKLKLTPNEGWSTEGLLEDMAEDLTVMKPGAIKPPTLSDAFPYTLANQIPQLDLQLSFYITRNLGVEDRVKDFFQDPVRLAKIKPVQNILTYYATPEMASHFLTLGLLFDESVETLTQMLNSNPRNPHQP